MALTPGSHALGYRRNPNRPALAAFTTPPLVAAPAFVDLRPLCTPVQDQGEYGTCVANATCAQFEYELNRQRVPNTKHKSRKFVYWTSGVLEGGGQQLQDDGRDPHYAYLALAGFGVPDETYCPYPTGPGQESTLLEQPDGAAYVAARHRKVLRWAALGTNAQEVVNALALGYSLGIGILVYSSFESAEVASTGVVPLPQPGESLLGGHMLAVFGYNISGQAIGRVPDQSLIVKNSWGAGFGDGGYVYLPLAMLTAAGSDGPLTEELLALELVTGPAPAVAQTLPRESRALPASQMAGGGPL